MSLKKSEKGAEPAREEIDEEGVPIWAGLGEIGGDDARGRVPYRFSSPHGQEVVPEVDNIDPRREVGEFCVRRTANSLTGASFSPTSLAAPLPLLVLGAMAAGRGRRIKNNGGAAAASRGESFESFAQGRRGERRFRDWKRHRG